MVKALDPIEGPSVWLDEEHSNDYTVKLLFGTDPSNPYKTAVLSKNEIEKLSDVVSS